MNKHIARAIERHAKVAERKKRQSHQNVLRWVVLLLKVYGERGDPVRVPAEPFLHPSAPRLSKVEMDKVCEYVNAQGGLLCVWIERFSYDSVYFVVGIEDQKPEDEWFPAVPEHPVPEYPIPEPRKPWYRKFF